jgi:hypothetical protein
MAQKTPMNVRIDADLKKAAEEAADGAGISLTEHVERSLKLAANPTCARCGRSSDVGVTPAGLSQAFSDFVEERRTTNPNGSFLVLTNEGGTRRAYWGRLPNARPQGGGALAMRVRADVRGKAEIPLLVPRGCIVGWDDDPDGAWFGHMLELGYVDGGVSERADTRARPQAATTPGTGPRASRRL